MSQIALRTHFTQTQSGCVTFEAICIRRYVHYHLPVYQVTQVWRQSGTVSFQKANKLCYWSLQHVYCLYTTEEAHLVMPSLPVSICAHQRELASKIKTESKNLSDSYHQLCPQTQ